MQEMKINLLGFKFSFNVDSTFKVIFWLLFALFLNLFVLYPFAIWIITNILAYCFKFTYKFTYWNYLGLSIVVHLIGAMFSSEK
ncbi:MAG TPA: hypothetical protein ENG48_04360 [Candidatus Atribacteria bacterium]|nr:hypothetical protein [Candidatus Atribacteria bacterium]